MVRGHVPVMELVRRADEIIVPSVVVAELRFGFALGERQEENELLLSRFLHDRRVAVVYPDELTTDAYLSVAVFARRHGKQLSQNDTWIAALAVRHDGVLVSYDRDFLGLSGLSGFQLEYL